MHQIMFHDRPQRKRREISQRGDDDHGAHQQPHEQRSVRGERAAGDGHLLLSRQTAGRRQNRNQEQEAADQHGEAEREVVPGRVCVDPGESAAVVAGGAGVGVQNFAEAVRSVVVHVGDGGARRIPVALAPAKVITELSGAEHQDAGRGGDNGQHRHLHFLLLELLAEILRRAAHHQTGDEHRDDAVNQNAVQARAHAAEDHFVGHHVEQRNQAGDGQ